jgi:hypothetical protein
MYCVKIHFFLHHISELHFKKERFELLNRLANSAVALTSVVNPNFFVMDPGPTFLWVPDPISDPTFFCSRNMIFKVLKWHFKTHSFTPFYLFFLLMFTYFFGYGPGPETLELWIRIQQKLRILADPDPQRWSWLLEVCCKML